MIRPPATPRYSQDQAYLAAVQDYKERLAEDLIQSIYSKVFKDLKHTLFTIAYDNCACTRSLHYSFIYRGKYYNIEDQPVDNPVELDASLAPRMEEYLAEYKQVHGYEVLVIKGFIKAMLTASDRISDYKQILPEQLHRVFDRYIQMDIRRSMLPKDIEKMKKRIEPFLNVMKGRMLSNLIQGQS